LTKLIVSETCFKLIEQASTILPKDVINALERAKSHETNSTAKSQLDAILRNIELAKDKKMPLCQDTGIFSFYLEAGTSFPNLDQIPAIIKNVVKKGTREIPLRPNTVDPFTGENTGDNTGRYIPYIDWTIVSGDTLKITVLPKGGGSENVCKLGMLSASGGIKAVKSFVINSIIEAGAKPCPPNIIGVGIGGGSDIAMKLAKKAVIKPIGESHLNENVANLEEELLHAANMTGIGPMGLGGKTTILDVHIEYAHRHPASLPVAVVFQCWSARRASAIITGDGRVKYLSHKEEI
jgi:fumarate hydratase subunit alpha